MAKVQLLKMQGRELQQRVEVTVADGFWSRALGLLPRKSLPSHSALLIKPCKDVHTWFMRFGIDVLFLDKNNKIIGIKENVLPYRFVLGPKGTANVLEMAANAAALHKLNLNDTLVFGSLGGL